MKGPIGRLASITVYIAPVEIPFEPPSEAAAGAVVKSVRLASKVVPVPVPHRPTHVRERMQQLRVTRIRIRRAPKEPTAGA